MRSDVTPADVGRPDRVEPAGRDERILVLMPTGKDTARTLAALAPAGLAGVACRDLPEVCKELAIGAGALLLTEETILRDKAGLLSAALRDQPTWSAVPLVVLAREGGDTGHKQDLFTGVGANVTLVERPIRIRTLRSVIQAALRTRRQQYDIRDALAERERQAAALRRNEAWLQTITDNLPALVSYIDRDLRYRFINRAYAEWFETTADGVIGRTVREVLGDAAFAHRRPWLERALKGEAVRFEGMSPHARLGPRQVLVIYTPHRDGESVSGIFVHVVDITDRKQAEERIQAAETEFRAVFESALDAILVTDDDGRYLAANPAASDLLGVPREEILGRSVSDFMEPGFDFQSAWREFLDHRHERGMIRLVRPDGSVREAEYSATREMRAGQHLSVVRDVTDRKRAEAALTKQTERLRLLWESASVLLTTDEPDAMMRGLFAKLAPHFGLDTYFNFMADDAGDALHLESCIGIPDDVARDIRRLEYGQAVCGNVALHRAPITATFIQQSDDPRVQLVKGFGIRAYTCSPLLAGDRLLGTLSFASRTRDQFDADELEFLATITRYVTVAYERLRLVRELRETDRRKDEFLALLAHELRNPLAPLRNGLQVMRLAGDKPDAVARVRGMMERQLAHMVRLIDDLLDVSRISRNKMELRRSRVLLSDVITNAVETARPAIETANHQLSVALPSEPVYLDADLTRLAQVFGNLLSNSAKYTEPGGRIWLDAGVAGGEVVVSVRDTGIGIPADALPTIFDMFSQVDRSLERSTGGLGIGLALVRGLVEMHGGTVAADSDGPGKGSTFTVRLPVVKARHDTHPTKPGDPETNGTGPRRRILVVDDNRDSAESMATLLDLLGNDVVTAHDGVEAVEAAERVRPDVVLMDVGMPRLNGYEATRRIREQPWGSDVTIIALTGWGQAGDRAQSRAAGCDGHLVKPVSLPDLERVLADTVGSRSS
jgi:PAS domain S-box-containing protein